ncbi:hypothetical protein JIN85_05240 [Luteolibacter pohnpeiensis]|uniref:TonB C-terminal domain-containing protein n=1 Tax=Luteolibacter pohnpeiensis TaxID=454153 RepID=A0A934S3U2_9BACT|nr:hypothetical protein [Luteolibacter pohnpeiensis]MBK1881807.1 hypothetical protein [Luteolibacter pohnpeiensis]
MHGDGRLWAVAFAASVLINLSLLALLGIASIILPEKPTSTPPKPQESPREASVLISPDLFQAVAEKAPTPPAADPKFARTSEDQRGKRPDKPAFMGERDTQATSDRPPDESAPALPSQAGIDPRNNEEMETTESDYQEGDLDHSAEAETADQPMPPVPPAPETPPTPPQEASAKPANPPPPPPATPPREALVDGPNPVDVPVPKEIPGETPHDAPPVEEKEEAKPEEEVTKEDTPPEKEQEKQQADAETPQPEKPATPPASGKPGFSGYQRKTAIRGNISRTGRSSHDVADTPLGRYQAAISKAVEREWQLNCVRNRDFIIPGYLTVRFFVEPSGKVRSVEFVGEMETGQIQKGFTLNSIRDAAIPAMPKGVREEYADEPLELIFNFYF